MISSSHCTSSLNVIFAAFYPSDPEWLSHSVGEILTFDGVKRSKDYYGSLALLDIPALIPLLFLVQVRNMVFTLLKKILGKWDVSLVCMYVRTLSTVIHL